MEADSIDKKTSAFAGSDGQKGGVDKVHHRRQRNAASRRGALNVDGQKAPEEEHCASSKKGFEGYLSGQDLVKADEDGATPGMDVARVRAHSHAGMTNTYMMAGRTR